MEESLESLASEIRSFIHANDLVEYPQVLDADPEYGFLRVDWDNEDWRAFLLLASVVGSRVVYVGTTEYSSESVLGPEPDTGEGPVQIMYRDDDETVLGKILGRKHDGETNTLRLAYVAEDVVHTWTTFAPWYEEALSSLEDVRERGEFLNEKIQVVIRELQERANREDWVTKVARDRRFFEAPPIPSVRQRIALEILAEISGLPATDSALVGQSWAVSAAAKSELAQVKRDLEEDAMGRLSELALDLMRQHPDWATLRITLREQYAKAYVIEKIGINLPVVAREVARYKD